MSGILFNTVRLRIFVGLVEGRETQQTLANVGFRSSTQPTHFYFLALTEPYWDTISARHHEIKPGQLAESESGASSRISSTKKSFPSIETFKDTPDIVCFSHLRWNFVFQRPQHILSRCAQGKRVFFVEEPIFIPEPLGRLVISQDDSGVIVVVPHLPQGLSEEGINADLKSLPQRENIHYLERSRQQLVN